MGSRFKFFFKKLKPRTETLSLLFHHYLKISKISPAEAMQVVMKKLKGRFALMVLIEEGKWLIVGCRDYPLAVGQNHSTTYFCTDINTLTQFSPSIYSVEGDPKPTIFATSYQSDIPDIPEIITPEEPLQILFSA
jgi:glucosamine 6-phosphate synthetase-like amidotransferase/phosphosugar isomerase protein